ncbi:MAG: hypothetical protein ACHQ1H_11555 [Nitrososphaerales archaeon]
MSESRPAASGGASVDLNPILEPTLALLDTGIEEDELPPGGPVLGSEPPTNNRKKNLTDSQRRGVYEFLLTRSKNGALQSGSLKATAAQFGVTTRTISNIWSRGKASVANGSVSADVSSRIRGKKSRPKTTIDLNRVKEIPLRQRKNIRSMAAALNVSKSTLHRRVREGLIKRHSSALKPYLTVENKRARLAYAISMLEESTLASSPVFKGGFDRVHIDEKWFYLTEENGIFYLVADEEEPHRTGKSKRFILKVMFLVAVARPRFNRRKNQWWSGKVGIFPFVFQEPAKRSSRNRPRGTLETKPIVSITKVVIKRFLIDHLFPSIRAEWPRSPGSEPEEIFVQQDNAKPHPDPADPDLVREGNKDGFSIKMCFQPPNSPDMNVLDLGFFRAIQSLQHQKAPNNSDELIAAVVSAFNEMGREKLNNVFLSLQQCLIEVMKVNGGNNYRLPHMGKEKLARQGRLPENLQCPIDVLKAAQEALSA